MHGGRSAGARWAAAAVVALTVVAGCAPAPAESPAALPAAALVADLPPDLLDELADRAVEAVPAVAGALPAADAEAIGRLAAPGTPWSSPPADAFAPAAPVGTTGGAVGQRVLDAVRPVLDGSSLDAPAELVPFVRPAPLSGYVSYAEPIGGDPTVTAAGRLHLFAPEVIPRIAAITGAVAAHERVAPLVQVGGGTEQEIITAHGRAHLALAVVVAGIVVPAAEAPIAGSGPEVVVGAALDAAARVLPTRPLPDAYPAAQLERRRTEYRIPNSTTVTAPVDGHRFGLAEGPLPATGEPADGLVTVVPGGLVVRTGTRSGTVPVTVRVLPGPPPPDDDLERRALAGWHEVVEVGYTAGTGSAWIGGATGPLVSTPPWPGSMRARVAARGRDDGDGERYEIAVWAAPPAPAVVVKATDRLGHRLRGEPEPPVVVRPESAYRWLQESSIADGATVTVATGSSAEQVVTAFGGDPERPVPLDDYLLHSLDPWVAVLPLEGAVLAVEINGWQGARDDVLGATSVRGRSASMYWSGGDALTNLAFAREGEVVDSFEPLFEHTAADAEVRAALAGIDWVDYTDLHEKGLVAVERFTGRSIGSQDVERIRAAGVAYRIPDGG
jgi:hypothetical protein